MSDLFPPLPAPLRVAGEQVVTYPAPRFGAGHGRARVVWILAEGNAMIAIVEDNGETVSVTNAAEDLHAYLREQLPAEVSLHVIEHWPAGEGVDTAEHFDRVVIDARGRPLWERLHPTGEQHPRRIGYGALAAELVPLHAEAAR